MWLFSGFGGATNTAFAKPAFGGTTAATGGTLFAATAQTPFAGGFGQNASNTGGFGLKGFGGAAAVAPQPGGIFNTAGATTGPFGTTAANPGAIAFGNAGGDNVPIAGTSNPPYTATQEKDPASSSMNHFQTITFMGPYQKHSLEVSRKSR